MMNSPSPPPTHFLLDHRVVSVTGRDAVAYLQAQTMNNVAALTDRHWQWSGWLTPKGRLIALFALLRLDSETLWLLLPDAHPHEIASRLQRFVFRSKATIAVSEDLHVSGGFVAPVTAQHAQFDIQNQADPELELDFSGSGGARVLRIGPAAPPSDAAALARWRAFDLEHGLPRLDKTQAEHWTPQQLSLDRLQAYSVKKGCYPGQEIVARTHFLGQVKRGLALLQSAHAVAAGDPVRQDDKEIGTVVSTTQAEHALALAVLPLQRSQAPIEIGGQTAAETAIATGLAR